MPWPLPWRPTWLLRNKMATKLISIRDARLAAQLTFYITNLIEFIADLEDEDQDEEDLMDIWDLEDIVDALDQLCRHLITEEPSRPPRQRPRHSRTIESFSEIDVGNLFRFRSHGDLRRLLAVWQLPVAPNGKISIRIPEVLPLSSGRLIFQHDRC